MKRKGDCPDTELEKAMERLDEAVLALETAGADIFGIISKFEERGVSVTTVCKPGDDIYWQKIAYALAARISDEDKNDDETAKLITTIISAMCYAAERSELFRSMLKDILIPELMAASEGKKIKIVRVKKGGTVS